MGWDARQRISGFQSSMLQKSFLQDAGRDAGTPGRRYKVSVAEGQGWVGTPEGTYPGPSCDRRVNAARRPFQRPELSSSLIACREGRRDPISIHSRLNAGGGLVLCCFHLPRVSHNSESATMRW